MDTANNYESERTVMGTNKSTKTVWRAHDENRNSLAVSAAVGPDRTGPTHHVAGLGTDLGSTRVPPGVVDHARCLLRLSPENLLKREPQPDQ